MAVNFNDDTWKYVAALCEKGIAEQQSLCVQPERTWEEVLVARGKYLALKQILNTPQQLLATAANERK